MPASGLITRILIADSRPLSAAALAQLIAETSGLQTCGCCHAAQDIAETLSANRPHLAIVDTELYDRDAQQTIRSLRSLDSSLAILLLTAQVDEGLLSAIADLAISCISPYSELEAFLPAIRSLLTGRRMLPYEVQVALTARLSRRGVSEPPLSDRERQMLRLAAQGLTVEQIGAALHISPHTAKTHLRHGYGKLKARNRSAAIATAMKQGML
jgi:DNA-binding NarL/FixJ family response regulator